LRLGFSTVVYDEVLGLPRIFEQVRLLGYDGIELNFKDWPSSVNPEKIRQLASTNNLSLLCIGTRYMMKIHGLFLASNDPAIRKRGVKYMRDCLDLATKLDIATIQMGWAFQGARLESTRELVEKNVVEEFKRIVKFMNGEQRIVIEPANRFESAFVHTLADGKKIAEATGSERIMVMADTFHMNIEEVSMEEALVNAGERLGYVQLSDSNRLAPGMGHIDFRKIIQTLVRMGYDGDMVMEFNPLPNPDEGAKKAIQLTRQILKEQGS
jgi:5-keto-L-gluconate epimerase